jgi:hypothetical protein
MINALSMNRVNIEIRTLACLLLLVSFCPVKAAILTASSTAFADVNKTVQQANAGDTVIIPPGTNAWTTTLTISGITLRGSGTNSTVIADETPVGTGTPLITVWTTPTILSRITQIQFVHGVTNSPFANPPASVNWLGTISIGNPSPLFRVDHCFFNNLAAKNVHINQGEWGLIDHCAFICGSGDVNAIEINGDSPYGDASWNQPTDWGGTNAVYIENNYFFGGPPDVAQGGRMVFRYNTAAGNANTPFFISTHGTEIGGGRWRGIRCIEVYNNTFTYQTAGLSDNFSIGVNIRGGSALVFSNTISGYYGMANVEDFRLTDNDADSGPWFGATGTSGWDSNSPALLSGVASATSSALYVANAKWTTNQWVGCTVWNTNNLGVNNVGWPVNTNNGNIGFVISNNVNTMFFKIGRQPFNQIQFTAGDSFVVHQVYAAIDAPGRGQGDLLVGDNPTPVWLHDAIEPIYFWNNTVLENNGGLVNINWTEGAEYPGVILENRDFFNSAKPDYTPLVYPHPLDISDLPTPTGLIAQ